MHQVRQRLTWSTKSSFIQQRRGWFLDAADHYCNAVENLSVRLADTEIASRALIGFRDFLVDYAQSSTFTLLALETKPLKDRLSGLRYCINVKGLLSDVFDDQQLLLKRHRA